MSQMTDEPAELARSWDANAGAWTSIVRGRGIESRRLATDAAIVDAVVRRSPRRVLDLGCGEGWLARTLHARGITVVGTDGSAALVEAARAAGGGEFHHLTYDELAAQPEHLGISAYDVVVCNFSLLHQTLEPLLAACAAVLADRGTLLIQTIHPWSAREERYQDGWRTESFAAFGASFVATMPWYYRTLGSWVQLLHGTGFAVEQLLEPAHPDTADPLSLIIGASVRDGKAATTDDS